MQYVTVEQTKWIMGAGHVEEAALARFELGYWGMLMGAAISAKYIGEVSIFPWLTFPDVLTTMAGGMLGAHLGAFMAQLHYNATSSIGTDQALAGLSSLDSSS